ncbi:SGNH/GDSL hydrolase family protein [Marinobacter sp. LN3S78]|uniref:SGNH/GDSL hydrolase family protein n=1 Tax=Marinobacter sp. LN3S78 TaxID=3382300 RepID=UPI00387B58B9
MFKNSLKRFGLVAVASCVAFNAWAIGGGGGSSADKMIIGDSIFALSGDIHSYLEEDLDENIDTHARSGCQVNGGSLICSSRYTIPNQYDDADKDGIETVIMNGGGNDFLLGDGADCETQACIEEVLAGIEQTLAGLFNDMQNDGIQEIIFLGYYDTEDENNVAINTMSMAYKAENYPQMGVDFIDTRPAFAGNESQYISSDGIHPTAAGSRVLADLILQELD